MLKFQNKFESWKRKTHNIHSHEKLFTHQMSEAFARLANHRSSRSLLRSHLYRGLETQIRQITNGVEYGFYSEDKAQNQKKFYRVVFWNLAGRLNFESLSTLLNEHPVLSRADIFCFAHSEIGMARSHNRNIIRSLALEKSCNYVSSCSYLHLQQPQQNHIRQNSLGIEGLSIMTPYPLANFRLIPMQNAYDPMRGYYKKIGCEKALIADLVLGHHKLMLVVAQLDLFSSPADRALQLNHVLADLSDEEKQRPILLAADLQTTTYNTKSNWRFVLNLINKIFRGFQYIAKEHHLNPQLFFDKPVFDVLRKHGFHFEALNELSKLSAQQHIVDFLQNKKMSRPASAAIVKLLAKMFFSHHDWIFTRPDWFAGNALVQMASQPSAQKPRVVENYSLNDSRIATHTPLVLDFEIRDEG